MNRAALLGTWALRRWVRHSDGLPDVEPLGSDPLGILVYAADGGMSVQMMRRGRPTASTDDVLGGTVEARAAAAGTYVAYAGRFVFDQALQRVEHHIVVSLFPAWVGQTQTREVRSVDGALELTTPAFSLHGRRTIARLVWHQTSTNPE